MRTRVNASARLRSVPEPPAELLTVHEAAALLRCGRTTVFRLIRDHHLPSALVAGRRLITRDDLNHYIDKLRDSR
jgi:excisionase family DNA binding protein